MHGLHDGTLTRTVCGMHLERFIGVGKLMVKAQVMRLEVPSSRT